MGVSVARPTPAQPPLAPHAMAAALVAPALLLCTSLGMGLLAFAPASLTSALRLPLLERAASPAPAPAPAQARRQVAAPPVQQARPQTRPQARPQAQAPARPQAQAQAQGTDAGAKVQLARTNSAQDAARRLPEFKPRAP